MLKRTRKTDQVAELSAKRVELEHAIEQAEAAVAAAEAALVSLAARETEAFLGEDVGDIAADRVAAHTMLEDARAELARLAAIAPELDRRIVDAQTDVQRAERASAASALAKALTARHAASKALAAKLPLSELAALEQARAAVDAAQLAYERAGGDDDIDGDEDEWPDAAVSLAEVLASGPCRPAADRDREAERRRLLAERGRRAEIDFVVQQRLAGVAVASLRHRIVDADFAAEVERLVEQRREPLRTERAASERGRRILA